MSIECLPRKLFSYIDLFFSRKISCEKSGKPRIAVFRSGGLGDLVLLTSLLVSMRGIFKDSKISLICDESHGDIYNFIDEYVDAIVTFDGKSFRKNVLYRWKFLKLISACSFDIFLHTGISRQQGDGDIIARSSNAKEIIGYKPRPWHKCEKEISDRWFTRLIDGEFGEIHELKRLKKFSDIFKVGDNISDAPLPKLSVTKQKRDVFVIAIGASVGVREWPAENFGILSDYIHTKTGMTPVIVGTEKDIELSRKLKMAATNVDFIDMCGKMCVADLIYAVAESKLLLCNESAPMHIGVAVGTPTVSIVSGGEYKNYCDYPLLDRKKLLVVSSEDSKCFNCGWDCIYKKNDGTPFPCLSSIDPEYVIRKIEDNNFFN